MSNTKAILNQINNSTICKQPRTELNSPKMSIELHLEEEIAGHIDRFGLKSKEKTGENLNYNYN